MASDGLQNDPELVEDPEEFRPERFLAEADSALERVARKCS